MAPLRCESNGSAAVTAFELFKSPTRKPTARKDTQGRGHA